VRLAPAGGTRQIDQLLGFAKHAQRHHRLRIRSQQVTPGVDHAVPIVTDTFFAVDPPAAGEALAVYAADVSDGHEDVSVPTDPGVVRHIDVTASDGSITVDTITLDGTG